MNERMNDIQMEYCENKTLRQLIDSDDLHSSEDKVWRLLREIAEGLEHIHSKVRALVSEEGTYVKFVCIFNCDVLVVNCRA